MRQSISCRSIASGVSVAAAARRGAGRFSQTSGVPSSTQLPAVRQAVASHRAPTPSSRRWATTSTPASQDKATAADQPTSKKLADVIADSIKASGPISVATFMRTCLLDPSQGYYASANTPGADAVNEHGRDVLGARGDFITSPEISQVFGELLAIFFVARWQASGSPDALRLVELGPGKGTLLSDMIRTLARFPVFQHVKTIHLVETSEGLMRMQIRAIEQALAAAGKKIATPPAESSEGQESTSSAPPPPQAEDEVRIEYFPVVDAVPIMPDQWTMLVAHEFFDALPIHIFEKTVQGWREVLVDVQRAATASSSPSKPSSAPTDSHRPQSGVSTIKVSDLRGKQQNDGQKSAATATGAGFRYVLSPTETPWAKLLAAANPTFRGLQPGQRVEVSPESWAAARKIGELVAGRPAKATPSMDQAASSSTETEQAAKQEAERTASPSMGGAALVVDYGDTKTFGGSFRAFKSHQIVDPLTQPGTADLTANVDFGYLRTALSTTDGRSMGPMFQSHFLASLGLSQRVEALVKAANSADRAKQIEGAAKRLVDPTGMGAQYKVLGVDGRSTTATAEEDTRVYPFDYEEELLAAARKNAEEEKQQQGAGGTGKANQAA